MNPLQRNPELERVILEDPSDPAAWLVYGDWLQSVGDPRGELVAVQARLARDPGNPTLIEAQRALFTAHGDALLDGLHEYLHAGASPAGPGEIPRDAHGPLIRVSWEFGFLWTATLKRDRHSLETFTEGLRALLTHPSAHFLHALSLGAPPKNDWQNIVRILTDGAGTGSNTNPSTPNRRPPQRPFRLLFLGDSVLTSNGDPRPGYAPLGDLSSLWPALPHLECLAIRGGVMSLGNLELSSLRELTIETSALERTTLTALGTREWPHLEKLELWFGERRCTCALPDLEPIFEGSLFPRLRHLAIRNCAFIDRVCHSLAGAKITKQLHVLDLSLGALTERGLDSLVTGRAAFEHLAVLDLHHHYIGMDTMRRVDVSSLAGFVDVSGPRYDADTYYGDPEPGPPKVWLDA